MLNELFPHCCVLGFLQRLIMETSIYLYLEVFLRILSFCRNNAMAIAFFGGTEGWVARVLVKGKGRAGKDINGKSALLA